MTNKRSVFTALLTCATFFSLALVLGGCSASHEPTTVEPDAGARVDVRTAPDVGSVDSGPMDGGLPPLCEPGGYAPAPALAACALNATGTVSTESESRITVLAEDCQCAEISCTLWSIEPGRLLFELGVCERDADCGGCPPGESPPVVAVSCPVPAVPNGRYQVVVNDEFIGELQALPDAVVNPARPLCSLRQVDEPICDLIEIGRLADGVLCYPQTTDVGRQPRIQVDAFRPVSGCDVRVVGNEVQLQLFESTCGGDESATCYPPALAAGEYTFTVNGEPVDAFMYVADTDPVMGSLFCEPIL